MHAIEGVKRTDLQRHDLSIKNRETIQARIDIAPGVTAPWHRHPGEEVIYVLEGTLEYQLEGKRPATYNAGEVLFIPAGVAHKAHNPGTTNGAELATYIVEKGKPLVVPAPDIDDEYRHSRVTRKIHLPTAPATTTPPSVVLRFATSV